MQTPAPATTEAVKPGFTSYHEITAGCPTSLVYHHALRHTWPLSLFPTSERLPEHRTGCQQKCEPVQQALANAVLLADGSNQLTCLCSFSGNFHMTNVRFHQYFTPSGKLQHLLFWAQTLHSLRGLRETAYRQTKPHCPSPPRFRLSAIRSPPPLLSFPAAR